jgi:hypothetical protein
VKFVLFLCFAALVGGERSPAPEAGQHVHSARLRQPMSQRVESPVRGPVRQARGGRAMCMTPRPEALERRRRPRSSPARILSKRADLGIPITTPGAMLPEHVQKKEQLWRLAGAAIPEVIPGFRGELTREVEMSRFFIANCCGIVVVALSLAFGSAPSTATESPPSTVTTCAALETTCEPVEVARISEPVTVSGIAQPVAVSRIAQPVTVVGVMSPIQVTLTSSVAISDIQTIPQPLKVAGRRQRP